MHSLDADPPLLQPAGPDGKVLWPRYRTYCDPDIEKPDIEHIGLYFLKCTLQDYEEKNKITGCYIPLLGIWSMNRYKKIFNCLSKKKKKKNIYLTAEIFILKYNYFLLKENY